MARDSCRRALGLSQRRSGADPRPALGTARREATPPPSGRRAPTLAILQAPSCSPKRRAPGTSAPWRCHRCAWIRYSRRSPRSLPAARAAVRPRQPHLDRANVVGTLKALPRIFDNPPAASPIRLDGHDACRLPGRLLRRVLQPLGWRSIDADVANCAGGTGHCCRILVGMQRLPHEALRAARTLASQQPALDNQSAVRFKKRLAEEFREQLTLGAPMNQAIQIVGTFRHNPLPPRQRRRPWRSAQGCAGPTSPPSSGATHHADGARPPAAPVRVCGP